MARAMQTQMKKIQTLDTRESTRCFEKTSFSLMVVLFTNDLLVGGWTNPFEKH